MTKLLIKIKINLIKIYKYIFSPLIGDNCRYITSCSDYYIESLKKHGLQKGSYMGVKRILSCHPINFLGVSKNAPQKSKTDIDKAIATNTFLLSI